MLNYIQTILTLIFAISVMYILLDCEIKQKKTRYLLGLYIIIIVLCDGFVIYHLGYITFYKLYPLLVHVPVVLAFMVISKFKPIKVLFIHWTVAAISISLSLIGLIILYFSGSSLEIVNIVCYILYLPTWFVIFRYLRPSFLYMMRNTEKGWLGFCIIPITYTITLYYYSSEYILKNFTIESIIWNLILIFILTLSAYFLIIRFFKQTKEKLTLENEQDLLKTQISAAKVHFEALVESQEKTILYRHDMRHHLNLINSYLEDNKKEEAQKYIIEVEKNIESARIETYCSNYAVNLVLSSYIAKARKEGIAVETQITLPENSIVTDMDLCVIFSNAIENAIHACITIDNACERTLKVVSKIKNNKLFIQFTNSFDGNIIFLDDMPISTKENHGLGTKSIAAITQKYGGIVSFSANNRVFVASIIL